MIAIIRISGEIGLNKEIVETLKRLRLRRKYSCVVIDKPTSIQLGMIKKVKNFVAFGEINPDTYKKLVEKRGQSKKPYFKLHPPRGGIDSKKHFGVKKGVLGDNKDKINNLIMRML